ncbi:adenylosuccinate lyase [Asanoa ishikariensis]|uniref:3-carboxy-cis,cis-muconate cycloisomerase n=1 Tax=Asanoa ishikariensis TaxID=137265 RepID=A0A1H3UC77_9ACTN|nr:lyase family protein [Asanoa ishikariensis]GIF63865.1 adenylosuccinate lyase [Asanoa ishikariensis]SDZ60033.1 3-carboxy-cis,cis-muconate cycloisomerase [Asanoa ishikariensis]
MAFDLLGKLGEDGVMGAVFSEERAVSDWLVVEAAFARALADAGAIDQARGERIAAACRLDVIDRQRLWKETRNVGYPILPLVKQIVAALSDDDAAWVHYGATTQDIMDCALALQLRDAADRLVALVGQFGDAVAALVQAHAGSVMPGRTHAQQAVPTTFGLKLAVYLDQLGRDTQRLNDARHRAAVVSSYGAGGTSAALGEKGPAVRAALAARLGLADAALPWHVARDRVAELTNAAALVAGTCVRFAREVVDLSRTEVGEVSEATGKYRGASSTMPQKSNPISAEAIIGFGVVAQSSANAMLRALEAGHERAAGEWQIEWRAVPDCLIAAASALDIAREAAEHLLVFPDRMRANLARDGGRIMAEAYMITLADHLGRDVAHESVYEAVLLSRADDLPLSEALRRSVSPELWDRIATVLPEPDTYLGNATDLCAAALRTWRTRA